jgi:ribosomal protein L6P/L9E
MDKEVIIATIQEAIEAARINKNADKNTLYNCVYAYIENMIIGLCQQNNISAGRIGIGFPNNSIQVKVWVMPRFSTYFSTVFGSTAELVSNDPVAVNEELIEEPIINI